MALLNPGAVKKKVNTSSGGQAVYLTPEQQQKVAGTPIGAKLGVAPAATTPTTTAPMTQTRTTSTVAPLTQPTVDRSTAPRVLGTASGRPAQLTTIDRSLGIRQDPMSAYASYFSPEYTIDRQKDIFKEVERARQSQIDAINLKYQSQVQTEQQAGQEDLARQRSMNLRAGLGGSDFGAAAKSQVRDRTNQRVSAIQANQDIAVGNVISEIEQLAQQRFQIEQNALQRGFSNMMQYQQYTQEQQQQARQEAVSRIAELGKAGLNIADIRERDPQLYETLTTASGMGDIELEAVLNNNKPKPAQIDYKYEMFGNRIVAYGVDPSTGEMKKIEQQLEFEVPQDMKPIFAPDGTMMLVADKIDPTKPLESQIMMMGNYANPTVGGGGGGEGGLTLNQQFNATQTLKKQLSSMNAAQTELKRQSNLMNIAWNRIASGEANDLNATSQAIITTFNKILDPTSVVREAEYDRTPRGQAIIDQIEGKIVQIQQGGGGLTKGSLKELVDLGNEFTRGAEEHIARNRAQIREEAQFWQLNPDMVVPSDSMGADSMGGQGNGTTAQIAQYFGYDYNVLKNQGSDRDILLALVQANNKSGAQYNFDNYTDQQIQDALLKAIAQKEGVTR